MIDRDQLMYFIRSEDALDNMKDNDKLECLLTIAQSMNERMENLIIQAINTWEDEV